MKHLFSLALLLLAGLLTGPAARAQAFVTYWTGDTADVAATPQGGVCLMGGATEHDSASAWFVRRAGGGDVVVLRATGADGYNDYFHHGLPGARPNSVLTIVCQSRAAAADPWVLRQVRGAEAVWFAGGDQADYVRYWLNTPLHAALQARLDAGAVFGGTSAGCAILGDAYYSALTGSVTSAQALANPFDPLITLGVNDFLRVPELGRLLTDTHFEARTRQGRLATFLARLSTGSPATAEPFVKGVGVEEYTAVCVDTSGLARVFGDGSTGSNPDVAWFVAPLCAPGQGPEVLAAGQPLTWNRGGAAFTVCRVLGTPTGRNTFNLRTFGATQGGTWEYWAVQGGVLQIGAPAPAFVDCARPLGVAAPVAAPDDAVVLAGGELLARRATTLTLSTLLGQVVQQQALAAGQRCPLPALAPGLYVLRAEGRARRVWVD